ncbi:DENN domain-containing protein 4C [Dinochytrium kinnereticum]|nr:DENN domain-containing protein 4C [Dinochytrium kinnereticum]
MEAIARSCQAASTSSNRNTRNIVDRRASCDSIHERVQPVPANSPAVSVSFFSKFNKSVSNTLQSNNSSESFTSSLDTLMTYPIAYPGPQVLIQSVEKEEEEETDQFEEELMDRSRKLTADPVRRRTRSTTPDYGDPNTLPPLAPLVLSGDIPGKEYVGVPVKPDLDSGGESTNELISPDSTLSPSSPDKIKGPSIFGKEEMGLNFSSIFSFNPSASQSRSSAIPRKNRVMGGIDRNSNQPSDAWSVTSRNMNNSRLSMYAGSTISSNATSPTYFQSSGNLQSNHGSQQSLHNSGDKLSDSRSQLAAKLVEGHSFVEVQMEPLNREADIGEDGDQAGVSVGQAPGVDATIKDATRSGHSFGRNFLSARVKSGSKDIINSTSDLGSVANISGSGGKRQMTGSTTLLKGDYMPRMPEHICRLCQQELRSKEDPIPVLKCEYCSFSTHASCLPLIECHPCITFFNERKIQASFLKVFTSLLKNYRLHLIVPEQVKQALAEDAMRKGSGDLGLETGVANIVGMDLVQDDWFKKEEFLASQDKESRPFLSVLIETQSFAQFTLDRIERPESDYEILFFDESIKAKLNRSKLKFSKETTPFLKDSTYNIRATVAVASPNLENLDPNKTYCTSIFPIALDSTLLISGRPVAPLVTPSDQRMMKSHTIELKRKQDFSKWMRTKLKHFQKIGGGEIVSIGHLSDEQRRELFEERLREVAEVIDRYEAAHLSSLSSEEIRAAIDDLHSQHLVLMRAADEEQLVDSSDQEELQKIYNRLFRVITIYEDHQGTIETPTDISRDEEFSNSSKEHYNHPLSIVSEVNKEILERGVQRDVKSAWRKVDREVSALSLPSSVRSRSSSLRSYAGKKSGLTLSTVIVPRDSVAKSLYKDKDGGASGSRDFSRDGPISMRPARGDVGSKEIHSLADSESPKDAKTTVMKSSPLSETPITADSNGDSATSGNIPNFSDSPKNWMTPEALAALSPNTSEVQQSSEPILGLNSLVAATKATMSSSTSLQDALDAIAGQLDQGAGDGLAMIPRDLSLHSKGNTQPATPRNEIDALSSSAGASQDF